jgi:hypothetical protein
MADGSSVHGFDESAHASEVNAQVSRVPGKTSGAMHGGGVVPAPGDLSGMHGYGEVTSGQKGHPGTD